MKSAYVSNVSLSIASSDKTTAVKILDVDSRCRVFQVRYLPAVFGTGDLVGMDVYSGDPGASGSLIYALLSGPNMYAVSGYQRISLFSFWDIAPHGILADDDIYVKGTGMGVNFASITYQLG